MIWLSGLREEHMAQWLQRRQFV